MPRLNAEGKSRLRVLWLSGDKAEAIAAELGISYVALRKNCQRMGLPSRFPVHHYQRPRHPALSPAELDRARKMWAKGKDTMQIAGTIGPTGGEAAVYNSLLVRGSS